MLHTFTLVDFVLFTNFFPRLLSSSNFQSHLQNNQIITTLAVTTTTTTTAATPTKTTTITRTIIKST